VWLGCCSLSSRDVCSGDARRRLSRSRRHKWSDYIEPYERPPSLFGSPRFEAKRAPFVEGDLLLCRGPGELVEAVLNHAIAHLPPLLQAALELLNLALQPFDFAAAVFLLKLEDNSVKLLN